MACSACERSVVGGHVGPSSSPGNGAPRSHTHPYMCNVAMCFDCKIDSAPPPLAPLTSVSAGPPMTRQLQFDAVYALGLFLHVLLPKKIDELSASSDMCTYVYCDIVSCANRATGWD